MNAFMTVRPICRDLHELHVLADPCVGIVVLTDSRGEISSPGFEADDNYPLDTTCKWRIEAETNQVTPCLLYFFSFNMFNL